MSEMTLFGGNSLVGSDLFKQLQQVDDNLAGGSGGGLPRISIRGGRFREIVGGEQVNVKSDGFLNVVIVNAAPISRTYFEGAYDPEKVAPPVCWSPDNKFPAADVPAETKQASSCADCPKNIRGSGQGESRACRFGQRIAVALEGKLDQVYQFQLPATSIFGDAKDGKMGMQAYVRYLRAHKTPSISVITQIYFDENSDTPKLFFKPVRPLEEEELMQAVELSKSDDAQRAITLTVVQKDKSGDKAGAVETPVSAPEAAPVAREEAPEPVKVSKKKEAAAPSGNDDLENLVGEWDD